MRGIERECWLTSLRKRNNIIGTSNDILERQNDTQDRLGRVIGVSDMVSSSENENGNDSIIAALSEGMRPHCPFDNGEYATGRNPFSYPTIQRCGTSWKLTEANRIYHLADERISFASSVFENLVFVFLRGKHVVVYAPPETGLWVADPIVPVGFTADLYSRHVSLSAVMAEPPGRLGTDEIYPERIIGLDSGGPDDALNGANGEVTGSDDVDSVKALRAALMEPFSSMAEGAVILDEFATATVPRKAHITNNVTPSPQGNFSVAIFPSPCFTAFNFTNVGGADSKLQWGGAVTAYNTNVSAKGIVSPNEMADIFTQFRVVGGGIRIRNLMTPLTATGRLEIVQMPVTAPGMSVNGLFTSTYSSPDISTRLLGNFPLGSNHVFTSFLALPGADEYTMSEIDKGDILCSFKVASPHYYEFRSTSNDLLVGSTNSIGVIQEGDDFNNTTGAVSQNQYSNGTVDSRGMNAILLRGSGFPAGSPVLEIEVILHIEGVPRPSGTSAFAPQSLTHRRADPLAQQKIVSALSLTRDSMLVSQVRAHAKNVGRGIGDAVRNRKTKSKSKVRNATAKISDQVIRNALGRIGISRGGPKKKKKTRKH